MVIASIMATDLRGSCWGLMIMTLDRGSGCGWEIQVCSLLPIHHHVTVSSHIQNLSLGQ